MSFLKNFIKTIQQEYFQVEPFLVAIGNADMDKFNFFMKEKITSKNINYFDDKRTTPLLAAVLGRGDNTNNRVDHRAVNILDKVDKPNNTQKVNKINKSNTRLKMVEALLKKGANPNFRNFENETVFLVVSKNIIEKPQLAKLAQDIYHVHMEGVYRQKPTKDTWEAYFKKKHEVKGIAIMKLLQQYGADIHAKDAYGNNALFYAAKNNFSDTFTYLLEAGVSPFSKNKSGISALSLIGDSNVYAHEIKEKNNSRISSMSLMVDKEVYLKQIIETSQTSHQTKDVLEAIGKDDSLMKKYGQSLILSARKFSLEESLPIKSVVKTTKI